MQLVEKRASITIDKIWASYSIQKPILAENFKKYSTKHYP